MPVLHNHSSFLGRIVKFEAHNRVAVSLSVAMLTFGLTFHRLDLSVAAIVSWDAFALCSLLLAWTGIIFSDAKTRVEESRLQDSSRIAISICVVLAAVAGLLSAGLLLRGAKNLSEYEITWHVGLAVLTVISSWLLVHTVLTLHYAHLFYQIAGASTESSPEIGLRFPEEKQPDFLDFAYFSFIIGMTGQTADVEITSRRIRRIALFHGILSFGFNAVIVALSLNLASSLF